MAEPLQQVADAVVRRAQRQGSVTARDVRGELEMAELPPTQWKDVIGLTKDALHYRQGRYYPLEAVSPRMQKEQEQQRAIQKVIRALIKQHKAEVKRAERRGQTRVDYIQPVPVRTEDGKQFTLLSRDMSTTGIRLLGTRRLLGQKVRVDLPLDRDGKACSLLVRILWTCALGDDLFENGGTFLEIIESPQAAE